MDIADVWFLINSLHWHGVLASNFGVWDFSRQIYHLQAIYSGLLTTFNTRFPRVCLSPHRQKTLLFVMAYWHASCIRILFDLANHTSYLDPVLHRIDCLLKPSWIRNPGPPSFFLCWLNAYSYNTQSPQRKPKPRMITVE